MNVFLGLLVSGGRLFVESGGIFVCALFVGSGGLFVSALFVEFSGTLVCALLLVGILVFGKWFVFDFDSVFSVVDPTLSFVVGKLFEIWDVGGEGEDNEGSNRGYGGIGDHSDQ